MTETSISATTIDQERDVFRFPDQGEIQAGILTPVPHVRDAIASLPGVLMGSSKKADVHPALRYFFQSSLFDTIVETTDYDYVSTTPDEQAILDRNHLQSFADKIIACGAPVNISLEVLRSLFVINGVFHEAVIVSPEYTRAMMDFMDTHFLFVSSKAKPWEAEHERYMISPASSHDSVAINPIQIENFRRVTDTLKETLINRLIEKFPDDPVIREKHFSMDGFYPAIMLLRWNGEKDTYAFDDRMNEETAKSHEWMRSLTMTDIVSVMDPDEDFVDSYDLDSEPITFQGQWTDETARTFLQALAELSNFHDNACIRFDGDSEEENARFEEEPTSNSTKEILTETPGFFKAGCQVVLDETNPAGFEWHYNDGPVNRRSGYYQTSASFYIHINEEADSGVSRLSKKHGSVSRTKSNIEMIYAMTLSRNTSSSETVKVALAEMAKSLDIAIPEGWRPRISQENTAA